MTTDDLNDHSSGIRDFSSKVELSDALEKELGDSSGYLEKKYREWCIQQPDEVIKN